MPYANGSLHLGHIAGAYLGADIFVRFQRMQGNEVLFVSGSDEYGTPITLRADQENTSPRNISDRYHKEHKETFTKMGIDFDIFSRTTEPEHTKTVQEYFLELLNEGLLTEKQMIAPYCPGCERFMPDRYITGTCPNCGFDKAKGDQCDECGKLLDPQELIDPICEICGTTPEFRETKHMFLRLDILQDRILRWLDSKSFWKPNILSFTRNFVEGGLKDRPITRDIEWGVPVPVEGYENKRIYVWFDALIGYVSFARLFSQRKGDPSYWKSFYMDAEVRNYYFIGKDNIPFHAIVWPGVLLGIERMNLPYEVVANEFLLYEGKQFSKSRGIGLTADEALALTKRDYLRYYLAAILPEGGDASFSPEDMKDRVNVEFIDKYGNFIHRVTSFAFNNSLSVRANALDPSDEEILKLAETRYENYCKRLEVSEIKKGLQEWLDLVKESNVYFNSSKPWDLIKSDVEKCETKIWVAYRLAQYLTLMIHPFVPGFGDEILSRIGVSEKVEDKGFSILENSEFRTPEQKPAKPFEKIELAEINPNPLDLRVAKVLEAIDHPNADALYVLKLSLGDEKRQIVAGLKRHYSTESLKGRKIIIVRNLKKAKLRGEVSEGMMLAADDGEHVKFVTVPEDIPEGSPVRIGGFDYNQGGTVEVKDLQALSLRVSRNRDEFLVTASLQGKKLPLNVNGRRAVVSGESKDGAIVK